MLTLIRSTSNQAVWRTPYRLPALLNLLRQLDSLGDGTSRCLNGSSHKDVAGPDNPGPFSRREEVMKVPGKIRTTVVAAALMAATVPSLSTSAEAAWGWRGGGWHHGGWGGGGWGWGGVGLGLAAGALIGGALAAPYYGGYYGYGYPAYAYGYGYPYYGAAMATAAMAMPRPITAVTAMPARTMLMADHTITATGSIGDTITRIGTSDYARSGTSAG
jgi:hypothetical protein